MKLEEYSKEELISMIKQLRNKTEFGINFEQIELQKELYKYKNNFFSLKKILSKINNIEQSINHVLKGDNLHSLNILNSYQKNTFDIVYIDPPYNLGKDFIYNDNYVSSEDDYKHSKWLSFMKLRLELVKPLMNDKGFIAISIDENEYSQLKLLCDQIFGENNRFQTWHVKVRSEDKELNAKNRFTDVFEYVLFYAKNINFLEINENIIYNEKQTYDISWHHRFEINNKPIHIFEKNIGGKQRKIEIFDKKSYKKIDVLKEQNEEEFINNNISYLKEVWASGSLLGNNNSAKIADKYLSPLILNELQEFESLVRVSNVGDDGFGYRYFVSPKKESKQKRFKFYSGIPLDKQKDFGINHNKKNETYDKIIYTKKSKSITNFKDFSPDFGNISHEGGVSYNSGKKPIKMLKEIINLHKNNSSNILDFFAGSGSTGHATLELNLEDKGERKFTLCQQNEGAVDITMEKIVTRLNNLQKNINFNYIVSEVIEHNIEEIKTTDEKKRKLSELLPSIITAGTDFLIVEEKSIEEFTIYKNHVTNEYLSVYHYCNDDKIEQYIEIVKKMKCKKNYVYNESEITIPLEDEKIEFDKIPDRVYLQYQKFITKIKEQNYE